jgi:hypothetical protein
MGLYDQFQFKENKPIDTYVGLPIDEAIQTAEKLEEKYYTNLAARNSIDIALGTFDTIEGDRPGYDAITKDVRSSLADMAKRGDYENMGPMVSALATKFAADPRLHAMRKSHENYQKYMDEKNRLGALGLDFGPKDFKSWDPETGATQVFEGSVQERLPWEQEQAQIVDQLTPDSIFEDEIHKYGDKFPGWLYSDQGQALTEQKVKNYINEQGGMDRYRDTASYKQQRAHLLHQLQQEGVEPTDEILQQFNDDVRDRLVATGMERVFRNVQRKNFVDPYALAGYKSGLDASAQFPLASPVTNIRRALNRSHWDPESKTIVNGIHSTAEDLERMGYQSETGPDGVKRFKTPGPAIVDPAASDPTTLENISKAKEVMSTIGSGAVTAINDYISNELAVENLSTEIPELSSRVMSLANMALANRKITPVQYDAIEEYYENPDIGNIESWKTPEEDAPMVSANWKDKAKVLLSHPAFDDEELNNALRDIHSAMKEGRSAKQYIVNENNIKRYDTAIKDPSVTEDKLAILQEYGKYLGPEYQDALIIGQKINSFDIGGVPVTGDNTVNMSDGQTVIKMMGTISDSQWNKGLRSAERSVIEKSGNYHGKIDDDRHSISYFMPVSMSQNTAMSFDKDFQMTTKLTPAQLRGQEFDRQSGVMIGAAQPIIARNRGKYPNAAEYLEDYLNDLLDLSAQDSYTAISKISPVVTALQQGLTDEEWQEFEELGIEEKRRRTERSTQ